MENYYTKQYYTGKSAAHRRAVYKGMGFTDEDLSRPLVAVVNTFSEVCPGHMHLNHLVRSVKDGIWQAGATPMEFSTISQCATQVLGLDGIRYDLPARELIGLDIETIVCTQLFDGLVVVTTCDKTIPGVFLAAARLDMPTVIVPGGIMDTGKVNGCEMSLADLDEKVFSGKAAGMSQEEIDVWENAVVPGCGACPIMGTANTMQCLSEVLGVSLPGSATQVAGTGQQWRLAKQAGYAIVRLIGANTKFSDIVTPEAMKNMITAGMSFGAASNSVLHMLALSHEMGYEKTINLDTIAEISGRIPCIVDVKPVGKYFLTDLQNAGGIPAVMNAIQDKLDLNCIGISGKTTGEIAAMGGKPANVSNVPVVRDKNDPVMPQGGIVVLRGNLAGSAVVRMFKHSKNQFVGKARVFDTQQSAMEAVAQGNVKKGDVLVLRFMGPQGGPGMPDCFGVAGAVVGAGLEEDVAVITDGRFSGFAKGVGVCQINPEAAVGGPLARVHNGDEIVIDTQAGLIKNNAPDFDSRKPVEPKKHKEKGILNIYARIAGQADTGARL
ncbi:MAG: dihydroxy-acid dehydratase [Treponema sp.]|nr:dihydroxy-acid dehydratase [Treponema sp.]